MWAPIGTSGASGATGYPQNGEVVARGNKSEGFAQEVHRRHPPLGGGGPQRRVDRQRPRDESFVGAVVPLAQRHLPPWRRLDAARPAGLLILRRSARARRSRRLVRPRSRERPPLAEALEQHREGRVAPYTDQDGARPPWRRQKILPKLVRYNPVGSGRPTRRYVLGLKPRV